VTLSGGQAVRHPPVQVDRFVPSAACVYRVIPLGPVRDVPNVGELAMPPVTGPVALGIAGLAAMLVVGDPPVEAHAANSRLEARKRAAICRAAGIWISTGGQARLRC
jgi:hypothetical protein